MDEKSLLDNIQKAYDCAKKQGFKGDAVELFFHIEGIDEKDPIIGQDVPGTLGCKFCCSGGRCGICCRFPL